MFSPDFSNHLRIWNNSQNLGIFINYQAFCKQKKVRNSSFPTKTANYQQTIAIILFINKYIPQDIRLNNIIFDFVSGLLNFKVWNFVKFSIQGMNMIHMVCKFWWNFNNFWNLNVKMYNMIMKNVIRALLCYIFNDKKNNTYNLFCAFYFVVVVVAKKL